MNRKINLPIVIFLLALILTPKTGSAQKSKRERVQYNATILDFLPGYRFAYSQLLLKVDNKEKRVRFSSLVARDILDHFKVGDEVQIDARVGFKSRHRKLSKSMVEYISIEQLYSITKEDYSFEAFKKKKVSTSSNDSTPIPTLVFIDRKITDVYKVNGKVGGLYLDNGELLYGYFGFAKSKPLGDYDVGDLISCVSRPFRLREGEISPSKEGSVFSARPLTKVTGKIKSFLYKQNYAYVGLVLSTADGELRLSFPSEKAQGLKLFADTKKDVTIYYEPAIYNSKRYPPAIYAATLDQDTLRIKKTYWGSPDGKHKTETVVYRGKIRKVIKDGRNNLSVILTDDALMESTVKINQLRHLIKKGTEVEIKGEQRIKRPGELYEKDYKIIIPKSMIINGKEYLLQQ